MGDQVVTLLNKLESGVIRGATIAQQKLHLESLETTFKVNDEKLRKLGITQEDYFQNKYYDHIIKLITKCKVIMEASAEGTSYVTQQQMMSMQEDLINSLMQKFEKLLLNQMAQLEQMEVPQDMVKVPQNPENELTDQEKQGKDEIEITSNLLVQFRKEILKLEEDLSDIDSENLLILENKKNSWEKKIIDIKAIHRDLVINHSTKEDIDKELETIEKQHADALNQLLTKIRIHQDVKRQKSPPRMHHQLMSREKIIIQTRTRDRTPSAERERQRHEDMARERERREREAARDKERADTLARCQERQRERERLAREKLREHEYLARPRELSSGEYVDPSGSRMRGDPRDLYPEDERDRPYKRPYLDEAASRGHAMNRETWLAERELRDREMHEHPRDYRDIDAERMYPDVRERLPPREGRKRPPFVGRSGSDWKRNDWGSPRERGEWQGDEAGPPPPGRGIGFVGGPKRGGGVGMVGKIQPLIQQRDQQPPSEPDWDAEEGQIDTPKKSEGTPKRDWIEHDQREMPLNRGKPDPGGRRWNPNKWREGDEGPGPSGGYQRGPPSALAAAQASAVAAATTAVAAAKAATQSAANVTTNPGILGQVSSNRAQATDDKPEAGEIVGDNEQKEENSSAGNVEEGNNEQKEKKNSSELSEISDSDDDILNKTEKKAKIENEDSNSQMKQENKDAGEDKRDEDEIMDFEEISDGELEKERVAKGVGDALGVDWSSLVAETKRMPSNQTTTAKQKWQPHRIILDVGISMRMASEDYTKRLLNEAKQKLDEELKGEEIKLETKENMPWKPSIERACEVSARHAECTFKAVPRKAVWKKLFAENQWIFTVFDNFILTVDCGPHNRSWITLPSKGILRLSDGCSAKYEGISLTASQHLKSEVSSIIQASTWNLDPGKIEANFVKPFDISIINNTKDIDHLRKEVLKMKETRIELKRLQFHTVSGHTSLILISFIIIILIYLFIKNKCCKKPQTVKIDFSTDARQNVQN